MLDSISSNFPDQYLATWCCDSQTLLSQLSPNMSQVVHLCLRFHMQPLQATLTRSTTNTRSVTDYADQSASSITTATAEFHANNFGDALAVHLSCRE